MSKTWAILAGGAVVSALAVGGLFVLKGQDNNCTASGVVAGNAEIGGPFQLIDHLGNFVTDKDIITGPTLVYFGYTFCPDVCPFDVARNVDAVDILAEQGIDATPVFITIDPKRDTVKALADYAEVMHPKLIALTGTEEQTALASKAYKTYYQRNGDGEDYLMDHSTFTYLMDESGFVDFIRRDVTPDELAKKVACFAK